MVHGDDYVSAGSGESMDWLEVELAKAYEIQTQNIGSGKHQKAEGKVLNRILRFSSQRHCGQTRTCESSSHLCDLFVAPGTMCKEDGASGEDIGRNQHSRSYDQAPGRPGHAQTC